MRERELLIELGCASLWRLQKGKHCLLAPGRINNEGARVSAGSGRQIARLREINQCKWEPDDGH